MVKVTRSGIQADGAGGTVTLTAEFDAGLPDGCVRVATAHATTAGLGAMFANLTVERA
jgi:NADH-quinone oxidoreductase subunit G